MELSQSTQLLHTLIYMDSDSDRSNIQPYPIVQASIPFAVCALLALERQVRFPMFIVEIFNLLP